MLRDTTPSSAHRARMPQSASDYERRQDLPVMMLLFNILVPGIAAALIVGLISYFQRGLRFTSLVAGAAAAALVSLGTQCATRTGLFYRQIVEPKKQIAPDFADGHPKIQPQTTSIEAADRMRRAARLGDGNDVKKLLSEHPELGQNESLMRETGSQLLRQGNISVVKSDPRLETAAEKSAETFASNLDDYGPVLHTAAETGNRSTVLFLLEKRPDLAKKLGGYGETLLQAAINSGDLKMIDLVISKRPDQLTARGRDGSTALQAALRSRSLWTSGQIVVFVKLLLDKCPELAAVRRNGVELPDVDVDLWLKHLRQPGISDEANQVRRMLNDARDRVTAKAPKQSFDDRCHPGSAKTEVSCSFDRTIRSIFLIGGGESVHFVDSDAAARTLPPPPSNGKGRC